MRFHPNKGCEEAYHETLRRASLEKAFDDGKHSGECDTLGYYAMICDECVGANDGQTDISDADAIVQLCL